MPTSGVFEVLELNDVHTYYGLSHILQGISLMMAEDRKIVSMVGRNGAGKTTTLHSIMGFCQPSQGNIVFEGRRIVGLPVYKIVNAGISIVPQGRRIFASLTVRENLEIGARFVQKDDAWDIDRVYQLFPSLKKREANRGRQLSGGEMQMLAIGRGLMANPKLLIMDEPSEGLALLLVRELGKVLQELKKSGLWILLVEQNIKLALSIADYAYVISKGKIAFESEPAQLINNDEIKFKYLGV